MQRPTLRYYLIMTYSSLEDIPAKTEDVAHILKLLEVQHPIAPALKAEFYKLSIMVQLQAGEHLLYQGERCFHMYFIRKGALMAYSQHKQKQITTYISVENEFVSSLSGLYGQQPSREAIVAVEPTLLVGVHTDILQGWYARFFDLNFIIRQVYENYYRDAQERSHVVRIGNAKERYLYFIHSKPGYIDRLPLKCVASFLDMKPETLSRIKKQSQSQPAMDAQEADSLLRQAAQVMQETECFKEKTLKVHTLAERLGIPAYKLSWVLNSYSKTSFTDFVNQYRISYLKEQLEKEESLQNLTLEALALKAGFASRSGFYKAFNKAEGTSPKAYLSAKKLSDNSLPKALPRKQPGIGETVTISEVFQ
ncbi:helix-turn-helix domain-containing protein [Rufibacter sediminis]|uniref:Helix-turn-helix domain-containing protein n=1 Tax=Rufibacter sediminis TaxID=2762756 RepID=A0ABR6VYL5_9BACT|nr:helix-turn-helix domain-containing protein [Rufibacter sediminis]MBC3542249.1 helix-turn-helix domain-containing protein [Rufibacter sediminis]